METESLLPKQSYGGGINRYMRRRRYERLDGGAAVSSGGKKTTKMSRYGKKPRKHFRIKAVPRLIWVVRSPLKMMTKLKNAYMNFMLKTMNTDNMFGNKRITKDDSKVPNNAFEARLIFEISKALVASHELYSN